MKVDIATLILVFITVVFPVNMKSNLELGLTFTKGSKGANCGHSNAETKVASQNIGPYIGCTTCRADSSEEHTQLHRNWIVKQPFSQTKTDLQQMNITLVKNEKATLCCIIHFYCAHTFQIWHYSMDFDKIWYLWSSQKAQWKMWLKSSVLWCQVIVKVDTNI